MHGGGEDVCHVPPQGDGFARGDFEDRGNGLLGLGEDGWKRSVRTLAPLNHTGGGTILRGGQNTGRMFEF